MRLSRLDGELRVKAIAGTEVILIALDMASAAREGLRGFAFKREIIGSGRPAEWMRAIKFYEQLVPHPNKDDDYSTREHPIQSFLWSDYRADVDTEYEFTIVALYGEIGDFEERHSVSFRIRTEKAKDKGHGVWFNRGAIASHALGTQFQNAMVTEEMFNDVSDDGELRNPEVKWLSRGLAEACLAFINDTREGEGLRVCAYEFGYRPFAEALKRALDRGVDVRLVYHDTKKENDGARALINDVGIPKTREVDGTREQIVFPRTRTAIPHNKFIVKLDGDEPIEVWTGSTNFTDTGFLGQTNVGHVVVDKTVAGDFLGYWENLKDDPVKSAALAFTVDTFPNPPNVIPKDSTVMFCSPRVAHNMLDWCAQRIGNAASLVMMTLAFNVDDIILGGLDQDLPSMRLGLLENEPTEEIEEAEREHRGKLAFSNGAILGKTFIKFKRGGAKVVPVVNSNLEKWFVNEELVRPTNKGHVYFVHSKFLLIDPLSDDPLICTGSANFSRSSLVNNDENMLLIRGDTRVADIYLTEFDRIFRHFYTRGQINEIAERGSGRNPRLLYTDFDWIESNFKGRSYKNNRRLMFFPESAADTTWDENAARDLDAFADEQKRADDARKARNEAARKRREAARKGTAKKKKTAAKKGTAKKAAKKTAKKAGKKAAKKAAKKKSAVRKTKAAPKKVKKKMATKKTRKRS